MQAEQIRNEPSTAGQAAEPAAEPAAVAASLIAFLRERFVDPDDELTGSTPLLETGVLNSVATAALIAFLRDEFGVRVPPDKVSGRYFRTVDRIADLVVTLRADTAGAGPGRS